MSEKINLAKWSVIIFFFFVLAQFLLIQWEQYCFLKLIKNQVSLGLVFGSLGSGKSLLFSWLVNRTSPTFTNFWHQKKNNKILLLDYLNIRGLVKIPVKRAFYYIDEVNLYFRGVEVEKNRKKYSGIEDFCVLARHFNKTILFSVQRLNQLWVAIRDIANVYIRVEGTHTPFFLPWTKILKIEVYEDPKLAEEWNSNMNPYRKSGMFSLLTGSDYQEAKKRLNIRSYRLFLTAKDYNNYDTKFFGALLPLLNEKRTKKEVQTNQIPVPATLKELIDKEFFTVEPKREKKAKGTKSSGVTKTEKKKK